MSDQETPGPNLRLMKAVVIILGIAILVLLGIVVVTIIHRLGNPEDKDSVATDKVAAPVSGPVAPAMVTVPVGDAWTRSLELSADEKIISASSGGGLITVVVGKDDARRVVILNQNTGLPIGEVRR